MAMARAIVVVVVVVRGSRVDNGAHDSEEEDEEDEAENEEGEAENEEGEEEDANPDASRDATA